MNRSTPGTGRHADVAAQGHDDVPEPIGTLAQARAAAEEYARLACTPMSTNDPGLMWATLAVAAELRALTLIVEARVGR